MIFSSKRSPEITFTCYRVSYQADKMTASLPNEYRTDRSALAQNWLHFALCLWTEIFKLRHFSLSREEFSDMGGTHFRDAFGPDSAEVIEEFLRENVP